MHAGESGNPDNPTGFRSISDRALDFSAGVPADPLLTPYQLVDAPGVLDIVHLGNRNTVAGSGHIFDLTPNGDDVGIQPTWLPNVDQSTPQVTTLTSAILLDAASSASLLYQISNGGGTFDVTFTFSNGSNPNAGHAILAVNVTGCLSCGNAGGVTNLGGGNGPTLSTMSNGNLGCDLEWTLAGATPNGAGFMLVGLQATTPIPLSAIFGTCTGTIHIGNPIAIGVAINGSGGNTFVIPGLSNPVLCGLTLFDQYLELTTTSCPVNLSGAVGITIGD